MPGGFGAHEFRVAELTFAGSGNRLPLACQLLRAVGIIARAVRVRACRDHIPTLIIGEFIGSSPSGVPASASCRPIRRFKLFRQSTFITHCSNEYNSADALDVTVLISTVPPHPRRAKHSARAQPLQPPPISRAPFMEGTPYPPQWPGSPWIWEVNVGNFDIACLLTLIFCADLACSPPRSLDGCAYDPRHWRRRSRARPRVEALAVAACRQDFRLSREWRHLPRGKDYKCRFVRLGLPCPRRFCPQARGAHRQILAAR